MMTREENICQSCAHSKVCKSNDGESSEYCNQYLALTALRPVSREQVEKVWRGEWMDKGWDGDFSWQIDGRGNCWKVIECSQCQCKVSAQTNFCPACGAPMTDEAVQMVIRRWEELYNA